ncbi:hypothetical protein [Spirulina sp. 06S082]|uniref:hypothetical protein n=1 Tax=Spirulina sp. 06S082 TaxID=3110248 RepID=UPI002B206819|nr:hypothetical protein [Spirulina sp. 06S082]MEA5471993.1 hypothetical protein [Spirulina sp. 06S082]
MNPIAKIVTFLGLSSLFLALPSPVLRDRGITFLDLKAIAQDNSNNFDNSIVPTNLELELLVKTIENFFAGDRYQTESQISLEGKGKEFSVTIRARSTAFIDRSQKFRSQFAFVNDLGEIQQEYEFISDGKQVWLYDKTRAQYAIFTLEEFFESDNSMALGISSFLFIEFANFISNLRETQGQEFSLAQILQEAIANNNILLQKTAHRWNNREYSVYEFSDPSADFNMSLWVDSETAYLKQIIASGGEENIEEFILQENIIRRQEIPSSENITFQFIPPSSVQKTETINIFDF